MSGNLARYLAGALTKSAPPGWRGVSAEHNLFSRELAERVGYSPAADLVVENTGQGRRIWVEFEISRADPVANHAKFAVAHLVQQFDDTFVSMVSTHVVAGRRALCAHAVTMMRRLGLDAFQTSLLPQLDGNSIKRLNHLTVLEISRECPPVDAEWDRLLAVATPFADRAGVRILLIGDPAEAAWNVHQWNLDLSTDIGRGQWAGKRVRECSAVEAFSSVMRSNWQAHADHDLERGWWTSRPGETTIKTRGAVTGPLLQSFTFGRRCP